MQASQIPAKFPVVWASSAASGYIRSIPTSTIIPGAASLALGFPPVTFQNEATGGMPLDGRDENGILNQITAWSQWQNMGGPVTYDATFATAIGGYPQGAWLYAVAGDGWWISLVDNNTSNPDTGGANWQYLAFGTSHYGNPNGSVAGVAFSQYGLSQALLWDTQNKLLWLCITTGTPSTAVWTQLTSSITSNAVWCGTSGGTVNAQVLTPPPSLQTLTAGTTLTFNLGSTLSNTGPVTLQIGSFGTFPVRKQSPGGSIALAGGELVGGNYVSGVYDGTYIQLTSVAMGTAAQANVSSNTGTVAAVTGSTTAGHVAMFSDTLGTVEDGGTFPAFGGNVINTSQNISPGVWYVDTTSGPITLTLNPVLAGVYTIIDATNNWSVNNVTINSNGHPVGATSKNTSSSFIADVSDYQFSIEAQSTYWRLV